MLLAQVAEVLLVSLTLWTVMTGLILKSWSVLVPVVAVVTKLVEPVVVKLVETAWVAQLMVLINLLVDLVVKVLMDPS